MINFKEYLMEASPSKLEDVLNKRQVKALYKHKGFKTYVGGYMDKIYVKFDNDDGGAGNIRDFTVTNIQNNYKMQFSITDRGQILGHSIYKKDANNWIHIKSEDGK